MTGSPAPPSGERGMILVIVLWTVAILTVIAVALTTYVQRNLVSVSVDNLQLRTELALRSGVQLSAAMVLSLKEDDRLFQDRMQRVVDLGAGRRLEISATDASASIDLNKTDREFMESVFITILESKGAGKELAEAVQSLRRLSAPADAGKGEMGKGGGNASVGEVSAPQKPARPAGKPSLAAASGKTDERAKVPDEMPMILTPLQLLTLPGVDPGQVNRLIPYAGVASKSGKINPMTAPEALLSAIPKISDNDLDAIRQARIRKDVKSEAFKQVMKAYDKFLTIEPPRVYRVSIEVKGGDGLISGSRQLATILLTPDAPKPFQVLSLSW
jgi:general secretion pathway protein K